jgi:hypothetical protein
VKNPTEYTTRPFQGPQDFQCPVCKLMVEDKVRSFLDDRGVKKYGGQYLACPNYWQCKYYVSPFGTRGAFVAIPPSMREE